MKYDKETIFVFGAGFTKTFLPKAPLMVDDYFGAELADRFKGFPLAKRILDYELNNSDHDRGKINLERLMTRLSGKMPYDLEQIGADQLNLLLLEVEEAFIRRLLEARRNVVRFPAELWSLALHLYSNTINCISFNYDDLLDQVLYQLRPFGSSWTPNSGYGFPCRISEEITDQAFVKDERPPMFLLKLHGSLNWRVPIGTSKPYPINAIRHHELWYAQQIDPRMKRNLEEIERYLFPEPVLVPPILTKSELMREPVLRVVWARALEVLQNARSVVFVGYSLPITDIAASTLFREGLTNVRSENVEIIDFAESDDEKAAKVRSLLKSYQAVFPQLIETQIVFSGARRWINDEIMEWFHDSRGQPVAYATGAGLAFNLNGTCIGTIGSWPEFPDDRELMRRGYRGELVEGNRLLYREGKRPSNLDIGGDQCSFIPLPPLVHANIEPCCLPTGFRDLTEEDLNPRDRRQG